MSETKQNTVDKHEADKTVTKELEDTFPASDPPSTSQPGSGITGTEPPPKGTPQREQGKS